ncbi:uncharacterized protein LOC122253615 [Penaeus japonicus]|uniref:uncharacterized protein LOC122253615 n=1 Tax=Penaeus japonicus TaxID=27405 RepID=UPI001C715CB5|nr:uncharacterized protein LOC122253615 [Penaeus japonicus]
MVRLWGVSKKNFTGAIFSVALLWYVVREREGDGDGGEERDGRRRGGGGGGRMRVRRWAEEDRSSEYPEFDVLTEDHGEFLNPVSPELVLSSHYVSKPPSRSHLRTGTSTTYWKPSKQHLATPRDYFQYLHKPQFWCRKLIMIGGSLTCGTFGDESGLDGNKLICLDPPLELPPGPNPLKCLTLSFGTQKEVSFDGAMLSLPCEVHLFDVLPYNPLRILKNRPHAYFHQVGLANSKRKNFYMNMNDSYPMDTLVGHLITNKLTYRPINVLKIDIEGDEWEVLEHLAKENILDIVGQIAVEVHTYDAMKLPLEERLTYFQKRYDILRAIEARGFLRAAYWDNMQDEESRYHTPEGSQHNTCGEILYVNSNWYNNTFKGRLRKSGVPVRVDGVV